MISRRLLVQSLATLPLLAPSRLFAQAAPRVGSAPISVHDNKLWMPVRFGTRGPYDFIVDTGATGNLIQRRLARTLGLREVSQRVISGIGGTRAATIYEARDVTPGNIDIGTVNFAAIPDDAHRAAGTLSASLLTVADADLDFEAGQWRIYPDGRGVREGYEALPAQIRESARQPGARIFVTVEVDGQSYDLQVDTGAPPGVLLYAEAARRSGLWNDTTPFVPGRSRGIGGAGPRNRLVRARLAQLGTIRFERPLVMLLDPGTRSLLPADGLLGLGLLRRLNIGTEVAAHRLWAKRNALPAPPEAYNMSGIWVDEAGSDLVVGEVSPQSPGAVAGLAAGDRITGMSLGQWLRAMDGAPGTTLDLRATRGGAGRAARLTLRPFL